MAVPDAAQIYTFLHDLFTKAQLSAECSIGESGCECECECVGAVLCLGASEKPPCVLRSCFRGLESCLWG